MYKINCILLKRCVYFKKIEHTLNIFDHIDMKRKIRKSINSHFMSKKSLQQKHHHYCCVSLEIKLLLLLIVIYLLLKSFKH